MYAHQQRSPIRVLAVSPHPLLGEALLSLLATLPGVDPVGWTGRLEELSAVPPQNAPDLVLLACPQPGDLEEMLTLCEVCPHLRVLCVALSWTLDEAVAALRAGAIGCLSVDITVDALAVALRQAARGEVTLSADLAREVIVHLAWEESLPPVPYENLTPREQEVLDLVCAGWSNKEIAQRLYLSVRTVENHLANIYRKLGVRSRTEAAVLAVQQGWSPGSGDRLLHQGPIDGRR